MRRRKTRSGFRRLECKLCFETRPFFEFPDQALTAKCTNHSLTTCLHCIAQHIRACLEAKHGGVPWAEACCPDYRATLEPNNIAEFAFEEDWARCVFIPTESPLTLELSFLP